MENTPGRHNQAKTIGHNVRGILIYTESSKLESKAMESAYIAFKNGNRIKTWSAQFRKCNSVFHAELLAILKATECGNSTGKEYINRSDCRQTLN